MNEVNTAFLMKGKNFKPDIFQLFTVTTHLKIFLIHITRLVSEVYKKERTVTFTYYKTNIALTIH